MESHLHATPYQRQLIHRAPHLLGLVALSLIAYDAFRDVPTRPEVLDPAIWFALYLGAAASVVVFFFIGTRLALQIMTTMVAGVGLMRGALFLLDDGRLTPLGLNLLIALYATFAHRFERKWMAGR